MTTYKNPPTAIDLVLEIYDRNPTLANSTLQGIVLIERKHNPFQGRWALPGGFQEWDESLEETAVREGKEETSLAVTLLEQLKTYSDRGRDPRGPVNAIGYVGWAVGVPHGADDARIARIFSLDAIPHPLAFDHSKRIEEYLCWKQMKETAGYR